MFRPVYFLRNRGRQQELCLSQDEVLKGQPKKALGLALVLKFWLLHEVPSVVQIAIEAQSGVCEQHKSD